MADEEYWLDEACGAFEDAGASPRDLDVLKDGFFLDLVERARRHIQRERLSWKVTRKRLESVRDSARQTEAALRALTLTDLDILYGKDPYTDSDDSALNNKALDKLSNMQFSVVDPSVAQNGVPDMEAFNRLSAQSRELFDALLSGKMDLRDTWPLNDNDLPPDGHEDAVTMDNRLRQIADVIDLQLRVCDILGFGARGSADLADRVRLQPPQDPLHLSAVVFDDLGLTVVNSESSAFFRFCSALHGAASSGSDRAFNRDAQFRDVTKKLQELQEKQDQRRQIERTIDALRINELLVETAANPRDEEGATEENQRKASYITLRGYEDHLEERIKVLKEQTYCFDADEIRAPIKTMRYYQARYPTPTTPVSEDPDDQ